MDSEALLAGRGGGCGDTPGTGPGSESDAATGTHWQAGSRLAGTPPESEAGQGQGRCPAAAARTRLGGPDLAATVIVTAAR
jgi:hypothetical protein